MKYFPEESKREKHYVLHLAREAERIYPNTKEIEDVLQKALELNGVHKLKDDETEK